VPTCVAQNLLDALIQSVTIVVLARKDVERAFFLHATDAHELR
jgi:hypothetical protein